MWRCRSVCWSFTSSLSAGALFQMEVSRLHSVSPPPLLPSPSIRPPPLTSFPELSAARPAFRLASYLVATPMQSPFSFHISPKLGSCILYDHPPVVKL